MDMYPDAQDSDSQPLDFEAIEFTENLAHSKAFEHYLFDHMAQRQATHTMTELSKPITLTANNIQTVIPEEVRDIFGDTSATVDRLSVIQDENHDISYTFMRFYVNGDLHTLTSQSDEDYATYTRPNNYGEAASYRLSPDTPLALLAGLVYVREYDAIQSILELRKQARLNPGSADASSGDLFSMDESTIDTPRIGNSDMIERLIMTLGHFDGLSEIKTSSFLPINNRLVLVSLTQAESPQLGYVSNELNLSVLEGAPQKILETPFDSLGLFQQLGDIKAFTGEDFNDQVGEITSPEKTMIIRPEKDTRAWGVLCSQFAHAMRTELEPYRHLDETL